MPSQQQITLSDALRIAVEHHQAGRLAEAGQIYHQILQADPRQPDALHLLGVIAHHSGELQEAERRMRQAIAAHAEFFPAMANLGNVLRSQGRGEEAVQSYRQALSIAPEDGNALSGLGGALLDLGALEEAREALERALAINPNDAGSCNNLGNVMRRGGDLKGALAQFHKALDLLPESPQILGNMGDLLAEMGDYDRALGYLEQARVQWPDSAPLLVMLGGALLAKGDYDAALEHLQRVQQLEPDNVIGQIKLGDLFAAQGRHDEAVVCYDRAISLDPTRVEAYNNLGTVIHMMGDKKTASDCFEKALAMDADNAGVLNNLGSAYHAQGLFDKAAACYEKALVLEPNQGEAHSNLANACNALSRHAEALTHYRRDVELGAPFERVKSYLNALLYQPDIDNETLFGTLRSHVLKAVESACVVPLEPWKPEAPPERLKVAYLSSDFRDHPVAFNLLPLLIHHDPDRFELYGYAELNQPDDVTERIKGVCHHWRVTNGLTDQQLAATLREDGIHIAVYLAGLFDANRTMAALYRPVPVQISYHSSATTALDEMDYWFTDAVVHPDGETEERFTEALVRLPNFYVYPEPEETPPVSSLPALECGHITFISLNNFSKINLQVVDLWGEVLKAVPGSKLLLKYRNHLANESLRQRVIQRFEETGISSDRLILKSELEVHSSHMANYHQADIALDPFPFTGATTTFQALWMGVPVITLKGQNFVGRMATDIVVHAGLNDLAVDDKAGYVEAAVKLAADLTALDLLRAGLRQQVMESPLLDGATYAREVEAVYERLWEKSAQGGGAKGN
ncbi:MAG: tetratricopeptide repeat protein [Magnetococcales bacterium]|nr:tetratricopeptide repeat protein [Magnetococcales bacterium]